MGDASGLFYRWEVSGKTVAVNLSLALVERLGPAIRQGGDDSHRRAEIGGFLLGSVKRTDGVTVVTVEDFEAVPCEHAFGESYFLSGDEQREFAARLRRKRKRGASLVGFFRSNTRKEFGLTVEDLDLMQRHFSKPSMVLLLVHAIAGEPLRGGFSIWEERTIRTTRPYGQFPFEVSALESESDKLGKRASEGRNAWLPGLRAAVSGAAPALKFPLRVALPRVHVPLRGRLGAKWIIATGCLATALLGGVLYRGSRLPEVTVAVFPVEPSPSRPIESAVHRGPEAVVASAAVAAVPAMMVPPKLTAPAPASPEPALPEPTVPPPAAAPVRPPATSVRSGNQNASRTAPFHIAPRTDAGVPALPALPAAPEVALALPKSSALPVGTSATLPPLPAPVAPFVTIAVEPLPNGHKGLFGRHSSHKSVAGANYVPPRLLQQHSVEVPADVRKRIQNSAVPIAVKLYLGREGKVEFAELLSDGTGPNRDLASLAVFASRKFQFSPALEGKETVPAEVLIRFRFGAVDR
jgi:hypothetical protein